ncbi:MAG: hypothetical protein KDD69_12715, partial [Bdellovibrionales bacterium]|nr:hypothetical protein [Bdellovibrionales bacterium]
RRPAVRFYNHMPAAAIRDLVGRKVWNSYFKFCVERNPWDRAVSCYFWRKQEDPSRSLEEFIDHGGLELLKMRGRDVYRIDGQVVVDFICRYEQLEEDLEKVRLQLGLPESIQLPHAKSTFRTDLRSSQELLVPRHVQRIQEEFADEIELLGYSRLLGGG